jgi:hypothetical protein
VVGVVDSIVAARENAAKFGYPVSPNRELVALGEWFACSTLCVIIADGGVSGASNLTASFMTVTGAVPIFGSITSGTILELARRVLTEHRIETQR